MEINCGNLKQTFQNTTKTNILYSLKNQSHPLKSIQQQCLTTLLEQSKQGHKLQYKRLLVKSPCLTLKKSETQQNIFACGTERGDLFIGNTETIRVQTDPYTLQKYYQKYGWDKLENEMKNPQILLPDVEMKNAHQQSIFDLQWFSNGKWLVTAGADRQCKIIDVETQKVVQEASNNHSNSIRTIAKSEQNNMIATGGRDGKIIMHDPRQFSEVIADYKFTQTKFSSTRTVQTPQITGLAFMKNYLLVAIESLSDKITFLDTRKISDTKGTLSSRIKKMFQGSIDNHYYHVKYGDKCTYSKGCSSIVIKNEQMLINTLGDMVNLYNLPYIMDEVPKRFIGHQSKNEFYVKANFGFNDDYILSGSEDAKLCIWDIKSQKLVQRLGDGKNYGHIGPVNEVVSVGCDKIVSGSDDGSVIVWNLTSDDFL